MTREAIALQNSKNKELRSKQLIISAVTGLYSNDFRKGKNRDKWNIQEISKFTNLTRQTVSKHLKLWEANKDGLFKEELGSSLIN